MFAHAAPAFTAATQTSLSYSRSFHSSFESKRYESSFSMPRQSIIITSAIISLKDSTSKRTRVSARAVKRARMANEASAIGIDDKPSFTVLKSALSDVQKVSHVVYDTKQALNEYGQLGAQAATVSPQILLYSIKNSDSFDKGALEGALVYANEMDESRKMTNTERVDLVIDKAYANLAAKFAQRVDGRVSIEVDARSSSTEAIVNRAQALLRMLEEEMKVPRTKLLFKIPATWEGIQAIRQLEAKGIPCHATLCYCLEQTALAAKANASLIQIYYARINAYGGDGLKLAQQTKSYIQSIGSQSKILAASIRSAEDAKAVAGCDYILLNERVLISLNSENSSSSIVDNVRNKAQEVNASMADSLTKETFEKALKSSPANDAIQSNLQSYSLLKKQLELYVSEWVGLNC
jgi:transaldolase